MSETQTAIPETQTALRETQTATPEAETATLRAQAATGPVADTFGWDTVYAIRYTDVNNAILSSWPSPPLHINQTSGNTSIDGDFAPWRVILGGGGHLLHMETRVPVLTYNNPGPATYDATAEIEVQLEFVPQPAADPAASGRAGTWLDLRLRTPTPAANADVTVLDVTYAGAQPDDLNKAIIKDLFRMWFNNAANLQNFNTVFASVNLNAKADVEAFQWLSPTHVSYAVAEENPPADGVFGVMCMTENRSAAGLAHQISAFAIPEGARSAFLISRERYLRKLLLPGIGLMFAKPDGDAKPWPEGYFDLLDDGITITNNEEIRIAQLEIEEGQTREARIAKQQFAVRLGNTRLVIDITDMKHDYQHGLLGYLKVNHTIHSTATAALRGQTFELNPGDGTHTIVVTKDPVAEWVEIIALGITLFAMSTGLAVAGYRTWKVGGAVAEGNTLTQTGELVQEAALPEAQASAEAAEGAGGVVATATGGLTRAKTVLSALWQNYRATGLAAIATAAGGIRGIMLMLEFIANVDSQKFLPEFNEFSAGVMAPVQWPNASQFHVTSVAFSGSLQAGGDPGFAQ